MAGFYHYLGVDEPFDPTHRFATSWILPVWVLFGIRAILVGPSSCRQSMSTDPCKSLYAFVVLFFIIGWDGTRGDLTDVRQSFSFFTDLTYWGLAFYFLFAAIHTFSYARTGGALLNRWPRPLQALHSIYYTSIVTLPFLVTGECMDMTLTQSLTYPPVVFWVVLFQPGLFSVVFTAWSNVSANHLLRSDADLAVEDLRACSELGLCTL